ncbi:MAG: UbiA family prenyltransferase [bacterium]|nr:UbiA family prenyltransferase [bacterium]
MDPEGPEAGGAGSGDGGSLPLVVDLDGTLVATDTLWECTLALLRERPGSAWALPFWVLGGRARFKSELAARVCPDAAGLPYRPEVLAYLQAARTGGRPVVLATASHQRTAQAVADHLGIFHAVMASEGGINLKGPQKADALASAFGEKGFEYIGDASADRPVFARAAAASWVGRDEQEAERATEGAPLARTFAVERAGPGVWFRALRVHQWVKNVLILLPLLASHRFAEPSLWPSAALAFLCLSLCASAVYVFNDLMDLDTDRRHPTKCRRPFAAGQLSIPLGLAAIPVLGAVGLGLSVAFLPPVFTGCLGAYLVFNGLYTLGLKRVAIADMIFLACLYSLRVLAGGLALDIPVSPWLIGFSLFFFLNLAFLKRYADLQLVAAARGASSPGRDYGVEDAPLLLSLGPAAGYMGMVVLALYLQSENVTILYSRPELLWALIPLVAYWISRVWLIAHRGQMQDDPVLFATRDPISYLVGALSLAVMVLGTIL